MYEETYPKCSRQTKNRFEKAKEYKASNFQPLPEHDQYVFKC